MLNNDLHIDNYLDEVLKSDPGYSLPFDFESRISKNLVKRIESIRMVKEYLLYLGALVISLAVLSAFGYFLKLESFAAFFVFVSDNPLWIAGVLVIILFGLFADKVILPYFFLSQSLKKSG